MFTDINEVALVVTALLGLAVGSIWYSPFLFGKYWLRASGLREEDMVRESHAYARIVIVAFLGNLLFLFGLARFLREAQFEGNDITATLVSLLSIILALFVSMLVWEKKTYVYFLIHCGYAAVFVSLSTLILIFWPW